MNLQMDGKLTFSRIQGRGKPIELPLDRINLCLQARIVLHFYQLSTTYRIARQLKGNEGVQSTPPQNMILWHVDYFELKALEKQQLQEGPSGLPVTYKQVIKFPMKKVPSLNQEEENILVTGDRESMPKWTCTNRPTKITPIFSWFPPRICQSLSHNLLPQLQTPLSYHFSLNVSFLCLKVYKLLVLTASLGLDFPVKTPIGT